MIIDIKNLRYVYSPKSPFEKIALDDINLTIDEGDFYGIIGHTGSGKSTLISHLNALVKIQSGSIVVDGMDLSKKFDYKKLRSIVGMVFQYPEYQLFDETVALDVAFGPKNIGIKGEELDLRIRDAIALVGLDYDVVASRSPFELSGGQKRRVAIAGVLAMRPKILVLDEPTAGLDPRGKKDIMELILHIKKYCPTIIMISHNMDEIAEFCNKIAVISGGKIACVLPPEELFSKIDLIKSLKLELPLVTQIAVELQKKGLGVPLSVMTERELVREILRAKGVGNA